jgi:Transposase.
MKFWAWESCQHDGYRVCSLRTTSTTVRPLQSSVWCCLSTIRRSFYVVSWLVPQRPRNSRNSGLHPANVLRRRQRLMATVFWDSQGVIYINYLEKSKTVKTMPNYWADSTPNCRKTAQFGKDKSALLPWQRTGSHLHHRHSKLVKLHYKLLSHPPYLALCNFFCFQTWKSHWQGKHFNRIRRSSPPRRCTLQTLKKCI